MVKETFLCELCGVNEGLHDSVICDYCNQGFHLNCLGVTLDEVSECADWLCMSCKTHFSKRLNQIHYFDPSNQWWPLGFITHKLKKQQNFEQILKQCNAKYIDHDKILKNELNENEALEEGIRCFSSLRTLAFVRAHLATERTNFPYMVDDICIHSLGKIDTGVKYHSSHSIWPPGYCATWQNPIRGHLVMSEIIAGTSGPVFKISLIRVLKGKESVTVKKGIAETGLNDESKEKLNSLVNGFNRPTEVSSMDELHKGKIDCDELKNNTKMQLSYFELSKYHSQTVIFFITSSSSITEAERTFSARYMQYLIKETFSKSKNVHKNDKTQNNKPSNCLLSEEKRKIIHKKWFCFTNEVIQLIEGLNNANHCKKYIFQEQSEWFNQSQSQSQNQVKNSSHSVPMEKSSAVEKFNMMMKQNYTFKSLNTLPGVVSIGKNLPFCLIQDVIQIWNFLNHHWKALGFRSPLKFQDFEYALNFPYPIETVNSTEKGKKCNSTNKRNNERHQNVSKETMDANSSSFFSNSCKIGRGYLIMIQIHVSLLHLLSLEIIPEVVEEDNISSSYSLKNNRKDQTVYSKVHSKTNAPNQQVRFGKEPEPKSFQIDSNLDDMVYISPLNGITFAELARRQMLVALGMKLGIGKGQNHPLERGSLSRCIGGDGGIMNGVDVGVYGVEADAKTLAMAEKSLENYMKQKTKKHSKTDETLKFKRKHAEAFENHEKNHSISEIKGDSEVNKESKDEENMIKSNTVKSNTIKSNTINPQNRFSEIDMTTPPPILHNSHDLEANTIKKGDASKRNETNREKSVRRKQRPRFWDDSEEEKEVDLVSNDLEKFPYSDNQDKDDKDYKNYKDYKGYKDANDDGNDRIDYGNECNEGTYGNDGNDGNEEWVSVLEPIKKMPTNVGSRIRNIVRAALKLNVPDWVREKLDWSISKEIYKGNAAGSTKRACIEILDQISGTFTEPNKLIRFFSPSKFQTPTIKSKSNQKSFNQTPETKKRKKTHTSPPFPSIPSSETKPSTAVKHSKSNIVTKLPSKPRDLSISECNNLPARFVNLCCKRLLALLANADSNRYFCYFWGLGLNAPDEYFENEKSLPFNVLNIDSKCKEDSLKNHSFMNSKVMGNGIGMAEERYGSKDKRAVSRPMDFRIVDIRLKNGVYDSRYDFFAADILQIWSNVKVTYNPSHPIYQSCITLSQFFETEYMNMVSTLHSFFSLPISSSLSSNNEHNEYEKIKNEMKTKSIIINTPSSPYHPFNPSKSQSKNESITVHDQSHSALHAEERVQEKEKCEGGEKDVERRMKEWLSDDYPSPPWEKEGCRICAFDQDESKVLLCDGCDNEYHMYCLSPPLSSIPEGNWYCPLCVMKKPKSLEKDNDEKRKEMKEEGEEVKGEKMGEGNDIILNSQQKFSLNVGDMEKEKEKEKEMEETEIEKKDVKEREFIYEEKKNDAFTSHSKSIVGEEVKKIAEFEINTFSEPLKEEWKKDIVQDEEDRRIESSLLKYALKKYAKVSKHELLIQKLGKFEYWQLSIYERVSLLKLLCHAVSETNSFQKSNQKVQSQWTKSNESTKSMDRIVRKPRSNSFNRKRINTLSTFPFLPTNKSDEGNKNKPVTIPEPHDSEASPLLRPESDKIKKEKGESSDVDENGREKDMDVSSDGRGGKEGEDLAFVTKFKEGEVGYKDKEVKEKGLKRKREELRFGPKQKCKYGREYLGRDDYGRRYWGFGVTGMEPCLIIQVTMDFRTSSLGLDPLSGGFDKGDILLDSGCWPRGDKEKGDEGEEEWLLVEGDKGIDQILAWLERIGHSRRMKETILRWRKHDGFDTPWQGEEEGERGEGGGEENQVSKYGKKCKNETSPYPFLPENVNHFFFRTKAGLVLEQRYGNNTKGQNLGSDQTKVPPTPFDSRLNQNLSGAEVTTLERITKEAADEVWSKPEVSASDIPTGLWRCVCLEPLFPSKWHCSICHESYYGKNDVRMHDKHSCLPFSASDDAIFGNNKPRLSDSEPKVRNKPVDGVHIPNKEGAGDDVFVKENVSTHCHQSFSSSIIPSSVLLRERAMDIGLGRMEGGEGEGEVSRLVSQQHSFSFSFDPSLKMNDTSLVHNKENVKDSHPSLPNRHTYTHAPPLPSPSALPSPSPPTAVTSHAPYPIDVMIKTDEGKKSMVNNDSPLPSISPFHSEKAVEKTNKSEISQKVPSSAIDSSKIQCSLFPPSPSPSPSPFHLPPLPPRDLPFQKSQSSSNDQRNSLSGLNNDQTNNQKNKNNNLLDSSKDNMDDDFPNLENLPSMNELSSSAFTLNSALNEKNSEKFIHSVGNHDDNDENMKMDDDDNNDDDVNNMETSFLSSASLHSSMEKMERWGVKEKENGDENGNGNEKYCFAESEGCVKKGPSLSPSPSPPFSEGGKERLLHIVGCEKGKDGMEFILKSDDASKRSFIHVSNLRLKKDDNEEEEEAAADDYKDKDKDDKRGDEKDDEKGSKRGGKKEDTKDDKHNKRDDKDDFFPSKLKLHVCKNEKCECVSVPKKDDDSLAVNLNKKPTFHTQPATYIHANQPGLNPEPEQQGATEPRVEVCATKPRAEVCATQPELNPDPHARFLLQKLKTNLLDMEAALTQDALCIYRGSACRRRGLRSLVKRSCGWHQLAQACILLECMIRSDRLHVNWRFWNSFSSSPSSPSSSSSTMAALALRIFALDQAISYSDYHALHSLNSMQGGTKNITKTPSSKSKVDTKGRLGENEVEDEDEEVEDEDDKEEEEEEVNVDVDVNENWDGNVEENAMLEFSNLKPKSTEGRGDHTEGEEEGDGKDENDSEDEYSDDDNVGNEVVIEEEDKDENENGDDEDEQGNGDDEENEDGDGEDI